MINRVGFSTPYYTNNKVGFKATPQQVVERAKQVDPGEPDEIIDFYIDSKGEDTATLKRAINIIKKGDDSSPAISWISDIISQK